MTPLVSLALSGCALLTPLPEPRTLPQRLAAMPTEGLPLRDTLTIYWDAHQIPFIEADHDEDAAFGLGMVHAHLRLGQMELFRRISQGRLAESAGPIAIDIDHGLRALDYGRAVEAIEASMSAQTLRWVEAFVAGINLYQQRMPEPPHEFRVLDIALAPWTVRDLLAMGRLAGSDVNWLVWANLLPLREREDWPRLWDRLVASGAASLAGSGGHSRQSLLRQVLAGTNRHGSNSLAVAGHRTQTGAALIASDPHVGLYLPNLWLLAGLKSPSYHVVGVMIPGLPFFALGRNPWIAWVGTNMRAASSELIDISQLPEGAVETRRETIRVRWWFDRDVTLGGSDWGPVLSDLPSLHELDLPPVALKWTGHMASDEIGAMLSVARSHDFEEFRTALESFSVPGQNMLYADAEGNIGQVMAVALPQRDDRPPQDIILDPKERQSAWQTLTTAADLPARYNPARGFLASANNRPPVTVALKVGSFFSPDDRVLRMAELVERNGRVRAEDLKRIHSDTYVASSPALRDLLLGKIEALGLVAGASAKERAALEVLRNWGGHYDITSRGAMVFECFHHEFATQFYRVRFGEQDWAAFANVGRIKAILLEDIERTEAQALRPALAAALAAAADKVEEFESWGDMHRLRLAHPFGLAPLVGRRYRFETMPIGGSTDSLAMTAHGSTAERHFVRYGSSARHISDLSDADANWFVLLGGQDGWFNSANFADQVPLWQSGDYVQVPLRLDSVRQRFLHTTLFSR
jgi:penicillin amidase